MSMELDHSFTVPVPPDRIWGALLDVERVAPCMPGATVDELPPSLAKLTRRQALELSPHRFDTSRLLNVLNATLAPRHD
jgi:hypothetical protein